MNSGDVCPVCGKGFIRAYRSVRNGDRMTRYLHCPACKTTAGKEIIAAPPKRVYQVSKETR